MSKFLSTQTLLDFIDAIPKEEQNVFLVDFCRAIQKRKQEIINDSLNNLLLVQSTDKYDSINNLPNGVDHLRYLVVEKVGRALLGEDFHSILSSQSSSIHQDIDQKSTEAALQRVEELKYKYTPEQIAHMRELRAEVEAMLEEVEAIDERDEKAIDSVLAKYRISKYRGYKVDGEAIEFVQNENSSYKKWIDKMVIFKAEIRRIDQKLITRINYEYNKGLGKDPLMTEDKYTELLAAGVLGNEKQQKIAITLVQGRSIHRELIASIRG